MRETVFKKPMEQIICQFLWGVMQLAVKHKISHLSQCRNIRILLMLYKRSSLYNFMHGRHAPPREGSHQRMCKLSNVARKKKHGRRSAATIAASRQKLAEANSLCKPFPKSFYHHPCVWHYMCDFLGSWSILWRKHGSASFFRGG